MIPVVKWTGSKRSQSEMIVNLFPQSINTYYEPFCGGCSVLFKLLEFVANNRIKVNNFVCSDINSDLISLWLIVKDRPDELIEHYSELHKELLDCPNISEKSKFYIKIRDRYNKERNPADFYFINRTSYNGLIRYNSNGDYNVSFHCKRNGADIDKIKETISYHSSLLNKFNVSFICQSYDNIKPLKDDLLYLDPPYANSGNTMYLGNFSNDDFIKWLSAINCPYFLSYDGKVAQIDNTVTIDSSLYDKHLYLSSGKSSFRQLRQTELKNETVYESLYMKNIDSNYIESKLNQSIRHKPNKLF